MNNIVIYTDGGARGNPGRAGAGALIIDGDKQYEFKKYLGDNLTNNWAEYEALILALERSLELGFHKRDMEVRMDSELIVKQIKGEYRVKDKHLKEQNAKVRVLLGKFGEATFVHVPREENKEADRLVNEAIDWVAH